MNHEAIRKAYPNVQIIDETAGAFDFDGNKVELDQSKLMLQKKHLLMKRLLLLIKESVQLNTQQLVTN